MFIFTCQQRMQQGCGAPKTEHGLCEQAERGRLREPRAWTRLQTRARLFVCRQISVCVCCVFILNCSVFVRLKRGRERKC